ncbi:hypothetical protein GCM10009743_42050 [Kribbella swartbergensis]
MPNATKDPDAVVNGRPQVVDQAQAAQPDSDDNDKSTEANKISTGQTSQTVGAAPRSQSQNYAAEPGPWGNDGTYPCAGCGSPIERTGRRGRPRTWCKACQRGLARGAARM